ncbi:hypothetical protein [Sphingobium sp. YR768]|uniref:hypothetical protein n=1 Tax=Sphingobium sp. YR768 TaxID=1884365 RepID=UPI0008B0332F|nr:hypothetical protein [Sphingobium sp. YR768]SEQ47291.1 hypothetical protein SAMN05518866_10144 [Sphingobium sp. YR768]
MDAAFILSQFQINPQALYAEVQHGPVVSPITVHKVTEYGVVFSGKGIPALHEPVTIIAGQLTARAVISARTERRCALLFVNPVTAH